MIQKYITPLLIMLLSLGLLTDSIIHYADIPNLLINLIFIIPFMYFAIYLFNNAKKN